jgi:enoyl-CoA hydratase/carnithine racemase
VSDYQYLKVERQEDIVVLKLYDPPTLNAWNLTMGLELVQELTALEEDDGARVIVLTGEDPGFCSGANVKEMAERGGIGNIGAMAYRQERRFQVAVRPPLNAVQRVVCLLREHPKPVIGAINGAAAGAGLGLALACDIRIASERAKFGHVFVRRGLVPEDGSAFLLPQVVGLSNALELALTGDVIDAQRAERIGLVSRVVPHEQLLPEALALARRIADYAAPIAAALMKRVMIQSAESTFAESVLMSQRAFNIARQTEDHVEAVRAFVEKRKPRFSGR